MIKFQNGITIGDVMLDCVFGHSGSGIWQYKLASPGYRKLINTAKRTKTVVGAKSATEPARVGNYHEFNPFTWFKYVKRIEQGTGMHNAIGLTNRGVEYCAKKILESIGFGIDVKPNLYIDFSKGLDTAKENTEKALTIYKWVFGHHFNCLIKNDSCPNSGENIKKTIEYNVIMTEWIKKENPDLIVIDKVSIVHPFEMLKELERRGADAIMGINSIPFEIIYPYGKSSMQKVGGGGISGEPAYEFAFNYNKEARKHVSIPYLMGCGVMCKDDIIAYQEIGADAVVICSWGALYPGEVSEILKEFN